MIKEFTIKHTDGTQSIVSASNPFEAIRKDPNNSTIVVIESKEIKSDVLACKVI